MVERLDELKKEALANDIIESRDNDNFESYTLFAGKNFLKKIDVDALNDVSVEFDKKAKITTVTPTNPVLDYSNYKWYNLTPVISRGAHVNVSRILAKTLDNSVLMFITVALQASNNNYAFAKMLLECVNYYVVVDETTRKYYKVSNYIIDSIIREYLDRHNKSEE